MPYPLFRDVQLRIQVLIGGDQPHSLADFTAARSRNKVSACIGFSRAIRNPGPGRTPNITAVSPPWR